VMPLGPAWGDVVCHNDLFPPNVIFRDGSPVGLIDWDLAAPAPRLYDVASAANHWAPLADDDLARRWGLPVDRRGERLRLLCDGYGLERGARLDLLDVVEHRNRMGYEIHRLYGGERRLPGWREMWDRGSGDVVLARTAWFEANRADLRRSLL
jgi:aminoglycoside phosphotransferase (APT) family kinase protein